MSVQEKVGTIPKRALANLRKYKYSGVDHSIVSQYILNPFWNKLVLLWPTSVAPNTITLTGLCMVLFNFATLMYFDASYLTVKGGAAGPPQWIYYTWAAGLFIYQSLDAIDGKQARRTGMAGPLGEMFDHGCDAMNTTLEVMLSSYALNLGRSWWTVASQVATLMSFYLTTWEEYYTGQLYLGVFSGPIEGILMIVAIFAITGWKGAEFWDTGILTFLGLSDIPLLSKLMPDLPLNESFMVFGGFGLAFNIVTSYMNVYKSRVTQKKSVITPLLQLLPFLVTTILNISWIAAPSFSKPAILKSSLLIPFICAWGLQFAHSVGRLILAHITMDSIVWWDWMWVVVLAGSVDANSQLLFERSPTVQTTPMRTALAVYVFLALSFVRYGHFVYSVINEITEYLGIACFTVRKKDEKGEWTDADKVKPKQN